MGTDFYPRLTAVATDHPRCNQLVNQQALVSMLLAGPGVIATLTFAPLVLALFYSAKFAAAVVVLRWISMGMMLRVIAWPMGFIVVAKGAQKIFVWTEIAATVVHVGLAWLLVRHFGVAGAGMAFFGLYVWHGTLIYFIVRRCPGLMVGREPSNGVAASFRSWALVFVVVHVLPFWLATASEPVAVLTTAAYSAHMLASLAPDDRVSRILRQASLAPHSRLRPIVLLRVGHECYRAVHHGWFRWSISSRYGLPAPLMRRGSKSPWFGCYASWPLGSTSLLDPERQ